jgi:hypothetical protein
LDPERDLFVMELDTNWPLFRNVDLFYALGAAVRRPPASSLFTSVAYIPAASRGALRHAG